MPEVNRVYEIYRERGVYVAAVGTGSVERIGSIRAKKALALPIPLATDGWREALGVVAFPETLFIDRQGRIAERLRGGQDEAYFRARIDHLLAEDAASGSSSTEAPAGSSTLSTDRTGPVEPPSPTRHGWIARLAYRLHRLFH